MRNPAFTLLASYGSCPWCHAPLLAGEECRFRDALWPLRDGVFCPPGRLKLWHEKCSAAALNGELGDTL